MPSGLPSVDYIGIVAPFSLLPLLCASRRTFYFPKGYSTEHKNSIWNGFRRFNVWPKYSCHILYREPCKPTGNGFPFATHDNAFRGIYNCTMQTLCRPDRHPQSSHLSCVRSFLYSKYIICLRVSTELKEILPRIPARLRFFRRCTGVRVVGSGRMAQEVERKRQ